MKSPLHLLFLSIMLLCGCSSRVAYLPHTNISPAISQPYSENFSRNNLPSQDLTLTSAQSLFSLGEEGTFSFCTRTQTTNGLNHSGFKSAVKLLKNGKLIDIRQMPSVNCAQIGLSGHFSAERYLYAIRRIRI